MTSTLTLYFNSILNLDKNFALDDGGSNRTIEQYLSTLESFVVNNFQYIKHGLSISIKLEREQTALMMGKDAQDLNYIKIQNGTENPMYYFIVNKTWKSVNTIELVLSMDTINSFTYNKDYLINKRTFINRQHKDRMKMLQNYVFTDKYVLSTTIHTHIDPGDTKHIFLDNYVDPTKIQIRGGYLYRAVPLTMSVLDISNVTYLGESGGQYEYSLVVNVYVGHNYRGYLYINELKILKIVDLYSEGILAPTYKKEKGNIIDKLNINWYLLYRNTLQQDAKDIINTSPVECFLIPESPQQVLYESSSDGVIDNDLITANKYTYFFPYNLNNGATFEVDGTIYAFKHYKNREAFAWIEWIDDVYEFPVFYNTGSAINFYWCSVTKTIERDSFTGEVSSTSVKVRVLSSKNGVLAKWSNVSILYGYEDSSAPASLDLSGYTSLDPFWPDTNCSYTLGSATQITINGINSLDRTDSRIVKLIALPYCPSSFEIDSNGYLSLNAEWTYDSGTGFLKYVDLNAGFENKFTSEFSPFEVLFDNNSYSLNTPRNDNLESKLFHSDYYRPKFIYDSFSYDFNLENYDFSNYIPYDYWQAPLFEITFKMTRTINSKFLFKFDSTYVTHSTQDYDSIVVVSRNNEEVLYNSAYINYVRSGYNYDQKTLERQKEAGSVGIGLSLITSLVSIIGGVASQNYALAAAGVVTAGVGLASQITNLVKTTAQGEQSIQQKLDETSRQAVSVSGADDIDLLDAYADNRAKFVVYEVSDRMKKVLGDLFYYCGYKLEQQGIPNISSRYWFNFVQAELILTDTNNIPVEIEDDIKEKFKNGVTFFHYHSGFNFAQDKENWETSLVPYLEV